MDYSFNFGTVLLIWGVTERGYNIYHEKGESSFCICALFHCDIDDNAHKFIVKMRHLGTS